MSETETSGPPRRVLVRSKQGLEIFTVPASRTDALEPAAANARDFLLQGSTSLLQVAPNGNAAYVHLVGHGIFKVDLTNNNSSNNNNSNNNNKTPLSKTDPPFLAGTAKVQMFHQSPSGAYLLTWERWYEHATQNLKLWNANTGTLIASFTQRALKREGWPYLQWTANEEYAFLLTTNEVRVFTAAAFADDEVRYTDKLRIAGISSLSVPATASADNIQKYRFTSFCPGTKDKPARAGLHQYTPGDEQASKAPAYPSLLSKSLFQAEEMKVHWSPVGDAALITMQTSVDASGESYYGSSQLFLLSATATDVTAVPLPQEGPVHDVQWMPNPDKPPCFVLVAGKMPAMASLHHGQSCKPVFLFGNAHRNTIDWAPHGRFVLLAGFGNLAGGMNFWDRNKMKLIPHYAPNTGSNLRSEAVVGHGWSPDSRLFCVSTTTPRMNVDNGVRLYKYTGEELPNVPWNNANYQPDKLLQACFVPSPLQVYPDRPQSPPPDGISDAASVASSSASAAPPPPPLKPAGRYVPPSARRAGATGMSLAERMRKEKEGNLQGATKVSDKKTVVSVQGKVIPGLAPPDGAKTKSALKREKVKLAKQRKDEEEAAAAPKTAAPVATAEPVAAKTEAVDPEKRARKIKKTLKQIDDLKQRDAAELNDDQTAKVASEAELQAELASLGI